MTPIALLLFSLASLPQSVHPTGCKIVGNEVHTTWVHMDIIVTHPRPIASLSGVAVAVLDQTPMEGVLVEVFDHPEVVLKDPSHSRAGQRRLSACLTGKDGAFSFDAKPAKYELRFSSDSGEWECKSVIVEVRKTANPNRRLSIDMQKAN
jgi:hypothetical protein